MRFPSAGDNARQAVPYDDPLFPAFDGRGSLFVTDLAIHAPQKSAVLRAWVSDAAFPLSRPSIPG